ncbi:MAG: hypothetical protein MJZ16_00850 [Bacteroidales bacterium]|nr:hypothetical protein [Bacteroidales bacterium]
MKKFLFIVFASFLFCLQMSAQVKPTVRIPTPEEARLIKKANSWHNVAVVSTISSATFAAMAGIYQIERSEAEFRNKYNTDKIIVYSTLVLSATSAFVATIAWGENHKIKMRLPKNELQLKTIPTGLIIEF